MSPPRRAVLRTLAAAAALVVLTATAGCGGDAAADGAQAGELRYQGSVGQVTLPELAADLGYLGDVKLKWVGNTTGGPQDIQSAATGQTDFGGAFNGAVVKLAAADAPITAVVSYYGSDAQTFSGYYVLDDSPIRAARDLIGKKVGMNTLGAHAEAVLNDLARPRRSDPGRDQAGRAGRPAPGQHRAVAAAAADRRRGARRGPAGQGARQRRHPPPVHRLRAARRLQRRHVRASATTSSSATRTPSGRSSPGSRKAIEWARTHPAEEVVARFDGDHRQARPQRGPAAVAVLEERRRRRPGGVIGDRSSSTWIDWLAAEGELKRRASKAGTSTPTSSTRSRTAGERVSTDKIQSSIG